MLFNSSEEQPKLNSHEEPYGLQCPSCGANLPKPGFDGMTECKFCSLVVVVHKPEDKMPLPPYFGGTAEVFFAGGTSVWMPPYRRGW